MMQKICIYLSDHLSFLKPENLFKPILVFSLMIFAFFTLTKTEKITKYQIKNTLDYSRYNSFATALRIPFVNYQYINSLLNKELTIEKYYLSASQVDSKQSDEVSTDEQNPPDYSVYLPLISAWRPTIYYVDNSCSINGDGKTETCGINGPLNSLENAQSVVTGDQSGNLLLLKSGQTFSGQFRVQAYGTAGHPFTISSYGTGAKPIITGGDTNFLISCNDCHYIVVDGIEFSSSTGQHNILIIYPAGHITIQNCFSHNSPDSAITIYNSSNNTIIGNEVSWNAGDGIVIAKGDSPQPTVGNIISYNISHNNMRYGILVKSLPSYPLDGSTTKIYNNESYNNSTGIYLVSANGIELFNNNLHDNGKDCQGINDCPGEDYGFAIQSGSYNDFHDNIISRSHNTGIGVFGDQGFANGNSDGNRIYRNAISNTLLGYWKRDIDWQCYPGNSVGNGNLIYNNVVWGDGLNFVINDSNPNISGNMADNNVFYGGSTGVTFSDTSIKTGWTFTNNIFASNSHLSINATSRAGLTLLNNIYYKPNGGTLVKYNNITYNSTNITNLDASARITDPKFIGNSVWSDFRLQSSSPAIDNGINVGPPFNIAVNPDYTNWPVATLDQNNYGSGWEIGAFGYTK